MKTYTALALLALAAGCGTHEQDAAPKPVVSVKTAKVEVVDLEPSVHAPASVFAREQANVAGRITAPISKLLVRKGDTVAAGQVLAHLENRDLLAQRAESSAAVNDAEANLLKLTAGTIPTDIEKARGQVLTTEAALNQAQKFYDRRKDLFDKGAIPQRDLLTSQTDLAQAKANYDVAQRSLDLLEKQSRERDIQIAQSKVEQAKARLQSIEAQLSYSEIRSPFAGTVTEQFMFPGDMAKPDAPMFTVMDLSTAVARAQVPESDAGSVRIGQTCSFTSGDLPEGKYTGRISIVNQAVDPARRTVETWCEISNPKRALRGGVFGSINIAIGAPEKSVVVPLAAVQFNEGTRKGIVFLADAKQKAVKREIEAGETAGDKVRITKGLQGGETVIVEGSYGLKDGMDIKTGDDKKADDKTGEEKK
jgi:HlyD family secretion protein